MANFMSLIRFAVIALVLCLPVSTPALADQSADPKKSEDGQSDPKKSDPKKSDAKKSNDDENDLIFDIDPVNCIRSQDIRNTDIVDDRTILFYMRGSKIFLNKLPHRCSGLRHADSFSYKTLGSRLCSVDLISPLRPFDRSLNSGPKCGLGKFQPITKEQIDVLKHREIAPAPEEGDEDEA